MVLLEVKEADGKTSRWSLKPDAERHNRNGYKASELPPATMVTITGSKRGTTQKVGMLRQLTTAAGKTYGMFGPKGGARRR